GCRAACCASARAFSGDCWRRSGRPISRPATGCFARSRRRSISRSRGGAPARRTASPLSDPRTAAAQVRVSDAATAATHARPHGALLAAITGSGTLAMHMFVPALPAVAREFSASPGTVQLTLTVYLIGIAGGQLVYGPFSDRFGRRPVLIACLSVFLAATAVAAFATQLGLLIAARFVQAVGACGGLVLGRAMVRDGATPDQAARQLALLVMVMTAAPALAPLIGGEIQVLLGWRGIFSVLGAFSAVLLALTVF